jgi:hypothetical protein
VAQPAGGDTAEVTAPVYRNWATGAPTMLECDDPSCACHGLATRTNRA